jgi:ATP-binding cassette, subfamily B, bacterial
VKSGKIRISSLLRPHWKTLVFALIAVMVEGAADLLEPWPIKIVFDYIIGSKPAPGWLAGGASFAFGDGKTALLHFTALAVVAVAIAGAVGSYAEKYLTTSVGQRVMHDLRRTLYHHIQRLSLSYHDRQKTGDLIGRVTSDIDAVQDFISSALLGMLINVLMIAGMLAVMFYLDWRFTLIALSVAPLLFLVVYSFTHRIKKAARDVRKKESDVLSMVQESLSAIRIIKAFARESYEARRLEKESLENVEMALRARSIKAKLAPVVDVIVAAGTCLALWYGAQLVLRGTLTSGALLIFFLYLGKMYKPMRDLSKMTDTVSRAGVGFERIREVLNTESQVRNLPHARSAPQLKGEIEFENVYFGYGDGRWALEDISLKIEQGQFAAIVGPTGGGKSTLVSFIPRFYDPISGRVKIDGEDIRNFKLRSMRQQISFVLQDTLLFRAPIWQNIAYGNPVASRDEIIRAARLANAAEFIERMPEGYDTTVGERGVTLSGGQRQRIAIARAIIRNSPILILDEPTSGLDAESEELVFEALRNLMQGKTSIVVSHRLATITRADRIFVVKNGRIIEQGTSLELIACGGVYAQLHRIQFNHEEAAVML